jgi:hypothetical protein
VEILHHSIGSTAAPDFERIHQLIRMEPRTVLPVPPSELKESYEQGLSVILRINGESVGHMRLLQLISTDLKKTLGLPPLFPDIAEMGSTVIEESHRGKGLSELMRDRLLRHRLAERGANPMLVISTTKNPISVKSITRVSERLGLNFKFVHHLTYPMIVPLTCVCTPERGGGQGFRFNDPCNVRIGKGSVHLNVFNTGRATGCESGFGCVMYVSDQDRAKSINDSLLDTIGSEGNGSEKIGPQRKFVELLRGMNYYS